MLGSPQQDMTQGMEAGMDPAAFVKAPSATKNTIMSTRKDQQ